MLPGRSATPVSRAVLSSRAVRGGLSTAAAPRPQAVLFDALSTDGSARRTQILGWPLRQARVAPTSGVVCPRASAVGAFEGCSGEQSLRRRDVPSVNKALVQRNQVTPRPSAPPSSTLVRPIRTTLPNQANPSALSTADALPFCHRSPTGLPCAASSSPSSFLHPLLTPLPPWRAIVPARVSVPYLTREARR